MSEISMYSHAERGNEGKMSRDSLDIINKLKGNK